MWVHGYFAGSTKRCFDQILQKALLAPMQRLMK
jgi:hypothetical protein